MKKGLMISLAIAALSAVILFFVLSNSEENSGTVQEKEEFNVIINQVISDTELKDVNTGSTFKISDFADKPVLLESFAVWCPTCTRQQQEIKKFHEDPEIGDRVVSISLDTDPNEDEAKVLQHTAENGFDWHYVVSPTEFTQSLIDQFGIGIVNAPSAPVILICDGKAKKLDSGVKSVDELKEEVAGCQL